MKKIERPRTIDEVATMMHLAEFLLCQAEEILANIGIAPDRATPSPIYERMNKAHGLVRHAIVAFEETEKSITSGRLSHPYDDVCEAWIQQDELVRRRRQSND